MLFYKDKPKWRRNLEDACELLAYLTLACMIVFGIVGYIVGSMENKTCPAQRVIQGKLITLRM